MSDENINININVVTKKSITEAGNKLDNLGKKGAAAGKKIDQSAKNAKRSLDSISRASVAAAAGLASLTAVGVKSLNSFRQFESGLINVEKVTNLSGKSLASFGKEIDRMANRIPVGTSELLNLAQTAGQLGIQGAKDILAFTEAVALLTRTTDLTIDSAVQLAQLIAVSSTSASDIGRLSAVLVELGNNFSATESQILAVSTRIAQSTTEFNLLAEDAVALGAVIAGVGEKAEASGTAIGKTFRALQSAIISGGPPLQRLIDLTGLQREELRGLFESNPTDLLRKFTAGLGEAKKAGELIPVILADFGLRTDRVNRVLGPLIKNVDKVTDAFRRKEQQMKDQNAAIDEAEKQFRSLASAEILTKNATIQLTKTIGEKLVPAYRGILETIVEVSLAATRFVEDNSKNLKIITGAVAGLTIGLGALAVVGAIAFLGITVPMAAAIAVITLVGAGVGGLIAYWDQFIILIKKSEIKFLELKIASKDFFSSFSIFSSKSTDLWKEQASNAREQIKLIKKAIKEQEAGIKKKEEEKRIDEEKLQRIRELENTETDLMNAIKKGGLVRADSAKRDLKSIREQILELRGLNELSTDANKRRKQEIAELIKQRDILNDRIETSSSGNRASLTAEIDLIQQTINGLREKNQEHDNDVRVSVAQKRLEDLLRDEEIFNGKIAILRNIANDDATKGLVAALTKQREASLKSKRTEAINDGDVDTARLAQVKINLIETSRVKAEALATDRKKAKDEEKEKEKEIKAIKTERDELEKEEISLKAELKIETDAQELEQLRIRLQEVQIIKLEGQEREAELLKKHEERLKAIRDKESVKKERVLKHQTNEQIRKKKAFNAVQIELDKTTGQALADIGDNLFRAGIIRGKSAGRALKALKTSEAIVNTFTGATLALARFPGPAGVLAAAGVVASGLASVATIQSQKFATGGIVQPDNTRGRGIDSIPALLSVGEEVLTANNPRHRDNLSNDTQNEALLNAIDGLRIDLRGMQTIVNIDGKEVADVIQEQRFRGVS